jgi:hypothetical protein
MPTATKTKPHPAGDPQAATRAVRHLRDGLWELQQELEHAGGDVRKAREALAAAEARERFVAAKAQRLDGAIGAPIGQTLGAQPYDDKLRRMAQQCKQVPWAKLTRDGSTPDKVLLLLKTGWPRYEKFGARDRYRGGDEPAAWIDAEPHSGKPTLAGKVLAAEVMRVMGVPPEKPKPAKPKPPAKPAAAAPAPKPGPKTGWGAGGDVKAKPAGDASGWNDAAGKMIREANDAPAPKPAPAHKPGSSVKGKPAPDSPVLVARVGGPTPPKPAAPKKPAPAKPRQQGGKPAPRAAPAQAPVTASADDADDDGPVESIEPGETYTPAQIGLTRAAGDIVLETRMPPDLRGGAGGPDSSPGGRIGVPVLLADGETWAVVGATSGPGRSAYALQPVYRDEDWGQPTRTWAEARRQHAKRAPEDVPLDGVKVQDPDGGWWVLGPDAERIHCAVPTSRVGGDPSAWADALAKAPAPARPPSRREQTVAELPRDLWPLMDDDNVNDNGVYTKRRSVHVPGIGKSHRAAVKIDVVRGADGQYRADCYADVGDAGHHGCLSVHSAPHRSEAAAVRASAEAALAWIQSQADRKGGRKAHLAAAKAAAAAVRDFIDHNPAARVAAADPAAAPAAGEPAPPGDDACVTRADVAAGPVEQIPITTVPAKLGTAALLVLKDAAGWWGGYDVALARKGLGEHRQEPAGGLLEPRGSHGEAARAALEALIVQSEEGLENTRPHLEKRLGKGAVADAEAFLEALRAFRDVLVAAGVRSQAGDDAYLREYGGQDALLKIFPRERAFYALTLPVRMRHLLRDKRVDDRGVYVAGVQAINGTVNEAGTLRLLAARDGDGRWHAGHELTWNRLSLRWPTEPPRVEGPTYSSMDEAVAAEAERVLDRVQAMKGPPMTGADETAAAVMAGALARRLVDLQRLARAVAGRPAAAPAPPAPPANAGMPHKVPGQKQTYLQWLNGVRMAVNGAGWGNADDVARPEDPDLQECFRGGATPKAAGSDLRAREAMRRLQADKAAGAKAAGAKANGAPPGPLQAGYQAPPPPAGVSPAAAPAH